MKKRKNPEGADLLMIALAAGVGYWWWQRAAAAPLPAALPVPTTPAATIAASAVQAAAAPGTANYLTGGVFDNGSQIIQCPPNNGTCCVLGPSPGGGTFVDKSVQPC